MGGKSKKKVMTNQHRSLDYRKTCSSKEEATACWQVQTAAKHHGVCLIKLAGLLAGGVNLLSAIVSLAAFL